MEGKAGAEEGVPPVQSVQATLGASAPPVQSVQATAVLPIPPPVMNPQQAALLAALDTDGDGVVSAQELAAAQASGMFVMMSAPAPAPPPPTVDPMMMMMMMQQQQQQQQHAQQMEREAARDRTERAERAAAQERADRQAGLERTHGQTTQAVAAQHGETTQAVAAQHGETTQAVAAQHGETTQAMQSQHGMTTQAVVAHHAMATGKEAKPEKPEEPEDPPDPTREIVIRTLNSMQSQYNRKLGMMDAEPILELKHWLMGTCELLEVTATKFIEHGIDPAVSALRDLDNICMMTLHDIGRGGVGQRAGLTRDQTRRLEAELRLGSNIDEWRAAYLERRTYEWLHEHMVQMAVLKAPTTGENLYPPNPSVSAITRSHRVRMRWAGVDIAHSPLVVCLADLTSSEGWHKRTAVLTEGMFMYTTFGKLTVERQLAIGFDAPVTQVVYPNESNGTRYQLRGRYRIATDAQIVDLGEVNLHPAQKLSPVALSKSTDETFSTNCRHRFSALGNQEAQIRRVHGVSKPLCTASISRPTLAMRNPRQYVSSVPVQVISSG